MSTTYTPGPWKIDTDFRLQEHDRYYAIEAGKGYHNPKTNAKGFTIQAVLSEGDANLISAAPELLEELRKLIDYVRREGTCFHNLNEKELKYICGGAEAAVAKAEGKTIPSNQSTLTA